MIIYGDKSNGQFRKNPGRNYLGLDLLRPVQWLESACSHSSTIASANATCANSHLNRPTLS